MYGTTAGIVAARAVAAFTCCVAEVRTNGSGEVWRTGDRAALRVLYRLRGRDRRSAAEALATKVADADRVLARPGVEVRERRLSVQAHWEGKRQAGAEADQQYVLRVTDPGAVEDLLAALVATEPHRLEGPFWELTDHVEALREAQRLAVEEARRRAEGYAVALGSRLGPLVRMVDADEYGEDAGLPLRAMALHGEVNGPPDVSGLDLEPQPVTVRAGCTATWTLLD